MYGVSRADDGCSEQIGYINTVSWPPLSHSVRLSTWSRVVKRHQLSKRDSYTSLTSHDGPVIELCINKTSVDV
ncbi:unnamed protein product [Danaus chrysippus]|uniref:(African queen) hypothetical protein n=1 Tax=Danaus chrysippus TaxID=151541 RepID=A0A8J2QZ03_9NEOP|nr:unnamed protein product [Danaus chrysippus]